MVPALFFSRLNIWCICIFEEELININKSLISELREEVLSKKKESFIVSFSQEYS